MRGYNEMLVRLLILLMISISSVAFSCEKTIEAIKLIDLNYVTDLKVPFKQFQIETESKVLFERDILTAKGEFISKEKINIGARTFEVHNYRSERYDISYSIDKTPSVEHEGSHFNKLLNLIDGLYKLPICSADFIDNWQNLAVTLEISSKPKVRYIYVDKKNRQVVLFENYDWHSFYPAKDNTKLIIGSGYLKE